MSVVEELEDKVDQVRQRLDSAVEELRSFAQLKTALEKTEGTLADTGASVGELADTVEACVEELNGAASGLREVVAAFRSSELIGTVATLNRLEAQVAELPAALAAVVEKGAVAQKASMARALDDMKALISKEFATAAEGAQKKAASARGLQLAVLAVIVINIAISLWAVFK